MYRLFIAPSSKKQFTSIKKIYQQGINSTLLELKENPYYGKALIKDLVGKFSFRVGVYRVIYKINEKDKIISILNIGHRATVYK